jgi:hypothetical protein
MHIEPPAHAPQSLKDFGKHYLMIVLGILTAIGIEQAIESSHHRALAAHATGEVEEEIRSNLRETGSAVATNTRRLDALASTRKSLEQDLQQHDLSLDTFRSRLAPIELGVAVPALRRDAWDAAIASQALTYVDADRVRKYSEGYTAQRDDMAAALSIFTMGNWATQLLDVSVDSKLGKVDHAALLKAIGAYELTLRSVVGNELELQRALANAVGVAEPGTH